MAIRIDKNAAPVLGRITMPKGTFLNDPLPPFQNVTTAAVGQLGEPSAMMPAGQPYMEPGWKDFVPQNPGRNVQGGGGNLLQYIQPMNPGRNVVHGIGLGAIFRPQNPGRNVIGGADYPDVKSIWSVDRRNSLVGTDLGASPSALSSPQANSLFSGMTDAQVAQQMAQRGYQWVYEPGQGGTWVKVVNPSQQPTIESAIAPVDARGRPEWVDPTTLARNEQVTTSNGLTYVGGTPTEAGQAQYAVTYPGGVDDERYKWSEQTRQDRDGNWVKIYKRERRAQYTKQWRKKQQARAEEEVRNAPAQPAYTQPSVTVSPPVTTQGLVRVNLRADFG